MLATGRKRDILANIIDTLALKLGPADARDILAQLAGRNNVQHLDTR